MLVVYMDRPGIYVIRSVKTIWGGPMFLTTIPLGFMRFRVWGLGFLGGFGLGFGV